MKHIGDITKIHGGDIEKVDCITFGAPCTDLSIAGLRKGMLHKDRGDSETTRSGLFFDAVRLIKEMRENDKRNGRPDKLIRPRFAVYENVAGAFSSNQGRDWQAVLTEIIRIAEPEAPDVPLPEKGRWPHAGELHDEMGRWSVAYRLHDAQFWGVPQRRKRIALVADFQGGAAAEILFEQHLGNESRSEVQPESDSLPRDIKQSGTQRKDPTGTVRESTSETSGGGTYDVRISSDGTQNWRAHCYETEISRALDTGGENPDSNHGGVAIIKDNHAEGFPLGFRAENTKCYDETATTICNGTRPGHTAGIIEHQSEVYGISAYDSNAMKSANPNSGVYKADTARTLDNNGGSPACNQGGMAVVCLNDQDGSVMSTSEEQSATLRAQTHEPVVFENHCQDSRYKPLGDTCSTLATNLGTGGNNQPLVVKEPVCIGNGQANQTKESELVGALNCMHDQQAVMTYGLDRASYNQGKNAQFDFSVEEEKIAPQIAKGPGAVCAVDCRNGKESEINATLQADADHNNNSNNVCRIEASVRRLTPMEYERLQGFPDFWTDIGEWIDSKGKKHKPADAPRYKALGNSIALPFWFWLLRRISATYTRQATLGSLFDGIGGFPLCWELCNGKGTARFASEIEEFPIAVTKLRFPETDFCGGYR